MHAASGVGGPLSLPKFMQTRVGLFQKLSHQESREFHGRAAQPPLELFFNYSGLLHARGEFMNREQRAFILFIKRSRNLFN